jgi:hypothetical protein
MVICRAQVAGQTHQNCEMGLLALFHSPRPPLCGKKRREEEEKRFLCEMAASGGTFVPPEAAISHTFFKVPALRAGI